VTKHKEHKPRARSRYGIGEWYGKSFVGLSSAERRHFAKIQRIKGSKHANIPCPFKSLPTHKPWCTKEGGVCSIRLYEHHSDRNLVSVAAGQAGNLVTICPYRFQQKATIFKWIGETLLGHSDPLVVGEVGFLEQETSGEAGANSKRKVGSIDNVLVRRIEGEVRWCALEIQAVYFSGAKMSQEFDALTKHKGNNLPFPKGHRRPDFRSSGPKRLMPQLQIKVPTLRRWGKKMAVIVDRSFFDALGKMEAVKDVSSCDIAWFVVRYEESGQGFSLKPDFVRFTTLERAVEGLTGGYPVTLEQFETRIREKLAAVAVAAEAKRDSDQ